MGKRHRKILIVSGSYPYYGGEATTAYYLQKLLNENDFTAFSLFITNDASKNIDPDNTNRSYGIVVKSRTILHQLYSLIRPSKKQKNNSTPSTGADNNIAQTRTFYYNIRLLPKIFFFLLRKKIVPDIIITFNPAYYSILNNFFRSEKIKVIIGGCPEMTILSKINIDAQSVLKDPPIARCATTEVNHFAYHKMNVIYNSHLTQSMYTALGLTPSSQSVQYFNLAGITSYNVASIDKRQYNIAFVSSNFHRAVKNVALAKSIFNHFEEVPKIAIGINSDSFDDISNCDTIELTSQSEVTKLLGDTKLLLITSYFDSSPGVLSEAILSGCNVLVSKNVGWHEVLDERCVVQDFVNKEEWVAKAAYLMQNKIDYSRFENIIANSTENIIGNIETLLNGNGKK